MSKTVNNLDFFKQSLDAQNEEIVKPVEVTKTQPQSVRLDPVVGSTLRKAMLYLRKIGQSTLADQIEETRMTAEKDRFSIAIVGEFSRGKSTFLNTLLGGDILPVANLPTTAILTHIRYHDKSILVHLDENGKKKEVRKLNAEAWDDLTADNFAGNDPTGTALVGLPDEWLKDTGIELIDTPGAGDLEEARAQLIGKALLGADAAVITVSAREVLSMSEKLFIEQRLITRKTPYLMLILTKLDQVKLEERKRVISYVKNQLKNWKMDIPVFVPYDVELPDEEFASIVGMDKVKQCMQEWSIDPARMQLTTQWVLTRVISIMDTAKDIILEQKKILDADLVQQEEMIQQKLARLQKADFAWEDLSLQMMKKGNDCYYQMTKKAEAYAESIIERLQYEVTMSANPRKWWNESHSYRLKIELTNMASSIDSIVSRQVASDVRWLSHSLEQQFKAAMGYEAETIADIEMFGDFTEKVSVDLQNVDKQRVVAKIGSTALSLAAALALSQVGGFVLIATMGLGTGVSLITDNIFKAKIEDQRAAIKEAIRKEIPQLVDTAMGESEKRLAAFYNSIVEEASQKKTAWIAAQKEAIEKLRKGPDVTGEADLMNQLKELSDITDSILELKQ